MVERKLRGFTGYYFAIAEGTDTLPEFIKIIVAQDFLEEKYKRYDMRVLMDELPAFEECKFVMMFIANGIHWKLTHSCIDYRGEIASSEIGKMIELIEAKINSPIEVKKVEVIGSIKTFLDGWPYKNPIEMRNSAENAIRDINKQIANEQQLIQEYLKKAITDLIRSRKDLSKCSAC